MRDGNTGVPGIVGAGLHPVPKALQQDDEFLETAVDIADDVERPMLVASVDPHGHPLDERLFHFCGRVEHEHIPETLAFQLPQRPLELRGLIAHHVGAKRTLRAFPVAGQAQGLGHVQDNGHRQAVVLPGESHQRFARLWLYAGGVDDGEAAGPQARGRDEVEQCKGIGRCRLVGGVIRHHRPANVRGHHFRGLEVAGGKGGLPRTRGADENHQAQFGNGDLHCAKIPIWVGAP